MGYMEKLDPLDPVLAETRAITGFEAGSKYFGVGP